MKVWGFTIVKNAIKYDYPILESIQSILPVCDGVIVLHGDSEDNTAELLAQLTSSKVTIVDSIWTPNSRKGGHVLAEETNKAIDLIPLDTDWCFYIQADEVLHEKYIPAVRTALVNNVDNPKIKGLLFNYIHFYGSYDYIGKNSNWYQNEIRIIRRDKSIRSYKDAQGFRIEGNKKLPVATINASIYHYGWVKNPKIMQSKVKDFHKLWHDDDWIHQRIGDSELFDFEKIDVLDKFEDSHPQIMEERIKKKNWNFDYSKIRNKYSFKDKLKNIVKKITGWTPGEYKNYKIVG